MNSLDTLLDRIDHYFAGKKKNEVYLIFLMAFVVIGFVIYSYLTPMTENMLKQSLRSSKDIEKKLKDEQMYLASVSRDGNENYLIQKMKTDIEHSKISLEKTTYTNTYVDNKLKELSYLLFNDENWAKFLNSITQLAQKYAMHIKVIGNKINEPSLQKIEQVLTLKVDFSGAFPNTMKFMNAIEESELVVDIYELNCTGKQNIEGEFNVAVWGMKY